MRRVTQNKNRLLNEAVALDEGLENIVSDNTNIEKAFISRDNEKDFVKKIKEQLTSFEEEVFEMRINDYTFEEIANTLNKDIKSIYNTFQRIRQKIKKIMEIDD